MCDRWRAMVLVGLVTVPMVELLGNRLLHAQFEDQKITPSSLGLPPGEVDLNIGVAVAADADVIVIGGENISIFRRVAGNWELEQIIAAGWSWLDSSYPPGTSNYALAVSGDLLLISHAELDLVEVYRCNGGHWGQEATLVPSDGSPFDHFGCSVSVEGDVAVIGAKRHDSLGEDYGAAYVYRLVGGAWVQEQKLWNLAGSQFGEFGTSVALSGDLILVGETGSGSPGSGPPGSAHAYRYDPTGLVWNVEQVLSPPVGGPYFFGHSVSVSGDVALVSGVFYHRDPSAVTNPWVVDQTVEPGRGILSGELALITRWHGYGGGYGSAQTAAYRFDSLSQNWLEEPIPAQPYPDFGYSGAIHEETIVIGAPWEGNLSCQESPCPSAGSRGPGIAFVYEVSPSSGEWSTVVEYSQSEDTRHDKLGSSVAISNERILLGAPEGSYSYSPLYGPSHLNAGDGYAVVGHLDAVSTSFTPNQFLEPWDSRRFIRFGASVDMDGDRIAVGAPDDEAGSVYVFSFDSGTESWEPDQKLESPGVAWGFGSSVCVSNDRIVVGGHPFGGSNAVFVFRHDSLIAEWQLEQVLDSPAGSPGFAKSVSVDGDIIVVGTTFLYGGGATLGGATIFRFDPISQAWIEEQTLTPDFGWTPAGFGWSVAVRGETVAIGAPGGCPSDGEVHLFQYDGNSSTWTSLQSPLAIGSGNFGASVVLHEDTLVVGAPGTGCLELGSLSEPGSMYLYRRSAVSGHWTISNTLVASDGESGDRFGWAVATNGKVHLAGAPGEDTSASEAGACYLFVVPRFLIRGDASGDGVVDLADAINTLTMLFSGADPVLCDARDVNDDGLVDIADPIFVLMYLFAGGLPPMMPFPECGADPTEDEIHGACTDGPCV